VSAWLDKLLIARTKKALTGCLLRERRCIVADSRPPLFRVPPAVLVRNPSQCGRDRAVPHGRFCHAWAVLSGVGDRRFQATGAPRRPAPGRSSLALGEVVPLSLLARTFNLLPTDSYRPRAPLSMSVAGVHGCCPARRLYSTAATSFLSPCRRCIFAVSVSRCHRRPPSYQPQHHRRRQPPIHAWPLLTLFSLPSQLLPAARCHPPQRLCRPTVYLHRRDKQRDARRAGHDRQDKREDESLPVPRRLPVAVLEETRWFTPSGFPHADAVAPLRAAAA